MTPRRDPSAKPEPSPEESEEKGVREHPAWQRLEHAIVRALAPFAEARHAVALALDDVEPLPAKT